MKNLPDKLSDEQVKDLAIAGRVKFEIFLNHPQFFAVIDGDLYRYKEGESYHLLKRGYEEYKSKINELTEKVNTGFEDIEANPIIFM